MTHIYTISGMTCEGCVAKITKELLALPQVLSVTIDLLTLNKAIAHASPYHIQEHSKGNAALPQRVRLRLSFKISSPRHPHTHTDHHEHQQHRHSQGIAGQKKYCLRMFRHSI